MKSLVKQLRSEVTAALVAFLVSTIALVATLGFAKIMQRYVSVSDPPLMEVRPLSGNAIVAQGRHLYLMNCAHCHADDATGDEGPDLHGVKKSDARIAGMIRNGVKGEMPKFGQKLNDSDVRALLAYIRTLK